MRRTMVGLAILAVLLVGCGADEVPVQTGSGDPGTTATTELGPIPEGADGLDEARRRWAAAGIAVYTMTYRVICFCPETVLVVEVRDGEVVDAVPVATTVEGAAPVPGSAGGVEPLTVERMFDQLQRAVDEDAPDIQATYDPATGRPTRYWIDWVATIADEERGVEVLDFSLDGASSSATDAPATGGGIDGAAPSVVTTGTSQPPSVHDVAQAQFTEPFGCGYGFHASNADHTVAIQLWPEERPPAGESTADLATGWRGTISRGEGLLTVDCADRDLDRDPAPVESWPVTGGTLSITAPDGAGGGCGPGAPVATALATDLTVTTPDGGTITFAPFTLANDQWGCFAG